MSIKASRTTGKLSARQQNTINSQSCLYCTLTIVIKIHAYFQCEDISFILQKSVIPSYFILHPATCSQDNISNVSVDPETLT
ncbi:unnamed protein product [Adineta ricciae]|uniref:Uncharacterized protein n=1 Tax=Adineta ricciae TaxID=249248 RepID=A0A814DGZ2_ADIRI|nr:unnamed protein product [Adineta ricciae]